MILNQTKEQLTQNFGISMLLNKRSGLTLEQFKQILANDPNDKQNVFKNIYQMNLRSARRSSRSRYLVLLTMRQPEGVKEDAQQRESDILRDVITIELRKNDVFTKCSPFQYSLIIATTSMEGCDKAISRILDRFQQKKTIPETKLMYEYKHIN